MKAKFGHAGIVVRDLDSQIDFYSRIFGLEVETRFTREGSFIDNVTGLERARLEVAILGNEDRPSTIELLKYRSHPDHSPARAANAAYCSHVMFVVDDIESAWREVIDAGVRLIKDGGGLRAVAVSDGSEIPAHQAFWFAWSQFRPNTRLWAPPPA